MATFTSAQAVYGLNAIGTPTSTNTSGSVQVGVTQVRESFPNANIAYSLAAIIIEGSALVLSMGTGSTAGSTTWSAGVQQVETATAAGTISQNGSALAVVTGNAISGSPVTVSFQVASGDVAAAWAAKARTAISANTAISAFYSAGGTGASIVLINKEAATYLGIPIYATSGDAALNIALDNGTCAGITATTISASTEVGSNTSGVYVLDGDAKDFEGVTIPAITEVNGMFIKNSGTGSTVVVTSAGGGDDFAIGTLREGHSVMKVTPTLSIPETITATGDESTSVVTITIVGKTA